ncbi:MAG: protein rep [Planctomycetes bacterium]|nr:protein rep [Planctomycetota bacterium]
MLNALTPNVLAKTNEDNRTARENHSRLKRMRQCREYPGLVISVGGRLHSVARARCKAGLCPYCHDAKAATYRGLYVPLFEELCEEGYRFSLLTTTIPHTQSDDLGQLMTWLFDALRIFTRSVPFREHVQGYLRGTEVTNSNNNGFHPHAHFLIGASYWPLDSIIACWRKAVQKVCGRIIAPNGVDIKGIKHVESGIAEVVGYPIKLADLSTFTHEQIRSIDVATFRRHMIQPSKEWGRRARKLRVAEREARNAEDERQGRQRDSYVGVLTRIKRGDKAAERLALEMLIHERETSESQAAAGVIWRTLNRFGSPAIRKQLCDLDACRARCEP